MRAACAFDTCDCLRKSSIWRFDSSRRRLVLEIASFHIAVSAADVSVPG